jgi:outer membrane protein assembly factor BamA
MFFIQAIATDQLTIKEITFYGCKRSSPQVLLKKTGLRVGDVFTEKLPGTVKDRLINLEIFDTVEVEQRLKDRHVYLIISVVERAFLVMEPDVEFNIINPDFLAEEYDNSFFGIHLSTTDYSGGRKILHLNGGIGSQDRIDLGFAKTTSQGTRYGIQVGYNHYDSKIWLDDKIDKSWLNLHVSQNWRHAGIKLWAEFDRMTLDALGGRLTSDYWRVGLKGDIDFRDNPWFPRQGVRLMVGGYRTWDDQRKLYDALDLSLGLYIGGFKRAHAMTLCLRGHLTDGQVPTIDKLSSGGYLTIRGLETYENLFAQGVWGTLEYRIPLGSFKPSKTLFLASSIYLFADAGLFADKIKDLKHSELLHSAGLGFLWQIGEDGAIRFDLVLSPRVRFIVASGWKF